MKTVVARLARKIKGQCATELASGELEGRTEIFIHGDHPWRVVDVLLTNFHVPRSSLLAMIDAFVGPRWRDLYATALDPTLETTARALLIPIEGPINPLNESYLLRQIARAYKN